METIVQLITIAVIAVFFYWLSQRSKARGITPRTVKHKPEDPWVLWARAEGYQMIKRPNVGTLFIGLLLSLAAFGILIVAWYFYRLAIYKGQAATYRMKWVDAGKPELKV